MNRHLTKVSASLLALTIGLTLFTACNRTSKREGETVDDSFPWYNVDSFIIPDDSDVSQYDYRYKQFAGIVDDKLVFRTSSSYLPEGQQETQQLEELSAYDLDGNLIAHIELMETLSEMNLGPSVMVYSTEKASNGIRVLSYAYDDDYNIVGTFESYWDAASDELSDPVSVESAGYQDEIGSSIPLRTFAIGDKTIEYYCVWGDQADVLLLVKDSDGNESLVDLGKELPTVDMTSVYDIPVIMEISDGRALVCLGMYHEVIYADLDLDTLDISLSQNDYSWLDAAVPDIRPVEGLGNVVINADGISSIDFTNCQLKEIISYANSNVNRYVMDDLYPVMASEDRVVMTGVMTEPHVNGVDGTEQMVIMVFTKADSNPNAGKTIIKIASIPGYSYALCDAVCRFNENSDEYFAMFDTRYELDNFAQGTASGYGFDTLGELCNDVNSDLGNQLSVDLLAGEGPDIIIGGSSYSQINNPDYLIDLSDYISNNLSESDYFMNVIDAAGTSDAVYQIPISFCIAGITAPESDITPGQRGFTFDEYREFVSGPCNGADPLNYGKNAYFVTLMNSTKDLMIDEEGYFDFDNDAFRALAGYVDQNVNNPLELEDEGFYYPEADEACELVLTGINIYHYRVMHSNKVFVGYPSYDGRGPLIVGHSSIAVSAESSSPDGCLEFVSMVMSPECQRNFGCEYGIPVNREALHSLANEYVDGFNRDLAILLRRYSEAELRALDLPCDEAGDPLIGSYEGVIESLDGSLYTVDAPVDSIITEEIPGFFEGQKSLDEVISIVNNRARSVTDERI